MPGKLHGSDGDSKRNCLQDRATFYSCWTWKIVLILTLLTLLEWIHLTAYHQAYM